jgi:CubicO group peptidase (beta-lactamase class C family)
MKLVASGALSLDEDVNAKLKSWRLPDSKFTAVHKVTLRHLLTHTAGLTVPGFPGFPPGATLPTIPQVLDGVPPANTAPVRNDAEPGVRWNYSGGGIIVAQLLATDVTGEPFPALMQRLVLGPMGMTRSTFESSWPATRIRETAADTIAPIAPWWGASESIRKWRRLRSGRRQRISLGGRLRSVMPITAAKEESCRRRWLGR